MKIGRIVKTTATLNFNLETIIFLQISVGFIKINQQNKMKFPNKNGLSVSDQIFLTATEYLVFLP